MIKIGVSLVDASGAELQNWPSLPDVISHKGEDRTGAIVGAEFAGGALLVDRFLFNQDEFGGREILSEKAQFDGSKVIVTREYGAPDLAVAKNKLIALIKIEASQIILDFCPQYKQANLTAQAAELALTFPSTKGDDLPEPYKTMWQQGEAIWTYIKSVRAWSNTLEDEVAALSTEKDVLGWVQHDWPKP